MTREDVTNLLGVLQETYGKTFANPSGTVDAWLITLASYDARSIFKAARLYMESKTIKNFPSPADLIALITRAELVYPDEKTSRSIRSFLYPVFDEYLSSVSLIEEKDKIHAYSILKALDYMTNHFRENINLKSVASAIGYSESHISHSFSSVLSVSFRECLNMLRIEYAKKLILTTNMSTIHIGIESGFTCERSFHRAFFKSMNTTPAKYRQMHKNSIRKA